MTQYRESLNNSILKKFSHLDFPSPPALCLAAISWSLTWRFFSAVSVSVFPLPTLAVPFVFSRKIQNRKHVQHRRSETGRHRTRELTNTVLNHLFPDDERRRKLKKNSNLFRISLTPRYDDKVSFRIKALGCVAFSRIATRLIGMFVMHRVRNHPPRCTCHCGTSYCVMRATLLLAAIITSSTAICNYGVVAYIILPSSNTAFGNTPHSSLRISSVREAVKSEQGLSTNSGST